MTFCVSAFCLKVTESIGAATSTAGALTGSSANTNVLARIPAKILANIKEKKVIFIFFIAFN
jgi:hypothetical protein